MKEFQEIEWKEFTLSDLFTITSTSSSIDKGKLTGKSGLIPYVTRTDKNNGYDSFVSEQDSIYRLDGGNVITVGLDTQTVFYQLRPFYTGQNIQIFKNKNICKYVALFIIPLLKKQLKKYNWGSNGATLSRLKRSKIMLPVSNDGKPHYNFMKVYMKGIEHSLLKKYSQYIGNIENTMCSTISIDEKRWTEFNVEALFDLEQGKSKGLNHLERVQNGCNYLGATNQNNGVLCQVKNIAELVQKGNCIAFIRNGEGSMGYSVYQAESFIATSDITAGYNIHLNRYNGTFITTIADRVRGKYNFGYKRSGSRLAKEKIMLPVTGEGNPDYDYMEQYMKNLEVKQLEKYLKYVKNIL